MDDYFERLGLPRRFSVDPAVLERAYLDRSRAVHPDYHLGGSGADLNASLELSAALNAAYNVLKDPFARADLLLTLDEDGNVAAAGPALPPDFLAEMLEVREGAEAARGDASAVARLKAEFGERLSDLAAALASLFARHEGLPDGDPGRANLRAEIRGLLNRAKYVRRLIADLFAD